MRITELKANFPQDLILLLKPVVKKAFEGDYSAYLEEFYSKENLFPIMEFIVKNLYDILNKPEVKEQGYYWGYDVIFQLKRALVEGKHYSAATNVFKKNIDHYIKWVLEVDDPEKAIDEHEMFYIVIETIAQYEVNGKLEEPLLQVWNRMPIADLDDVFIFPIRSYALFDEEEIHKYLHHEGKTHTIEYDFPIKYDVVELYVNVIRLLAQKSIDQNLVEHVLCCVQLIYDSVSYFSSEEHGRFCLFIEKLRVIVDTDKIPSELFDLFRFFIDAHIKEPEDAHGNIKMKKAEMREFNKRFNKFFDWCILNRHFKPLKVIWENVYYIEDNNFEVVKNACKKLLEIEPKIISDIANEHERLYINVEKFFEKKEYELIIQMFEKGFLNKSESNYFEIAYSYSQLKNYTAAKRIYFSIIESGKESNAVCNNLGVIYSNIEKDNEEALKWFKKAVELDPDDQTAMKNVTITERELQEEQEKPKKLTESYFKATNRYHKSLLFTIYKMNMQSLTIEQLASATKQKVSYVEKNLTDLINMGMISQQKGRFIIDPVIEKLVEDYVDAKLERQIIQADRTNMSRPMFFHESEITLYRVLLDLFPQHFVFPNISLKTIVDVDKMRDAISSEHMSYLFMAHVDFAIISTSSYMPVLAIEKDSVYHDNNTSNKKDEMKNSIFKLSGIPLIRVRYNKAMTADKLKQEIRTATKELIVTLQKDVSEDHKLFSEIDVRNFGVSIHSTIDLDQLHDTWSKVVGEGISKKSKVIDLQNANELHVSISGELETIINFSKDQILTKIQEEIPQIAHLVIAYY